MKSIYLHGFASSPDSSKARFFHARMPGLLVPALDGGDFENLTITGQLDRIERTAAGDKVALIGSSMGGYLAALYAALHPDQVDRLVLMCPAFRFVESWEPDWIGREYLDVYHYAYGEHRRLNRRLIEDARHYPPEPDFEQPGLVFHGTRDDVVPAARSEAYAAGHPNVRLRLLESDHSLTDVTETIWTESETFLR